MRDRETEILPDDLPELGSDLVSALPTLDVNELAHDEVKKSEVD